MLKTLTAEQVRFIALLAKSARLQRDALLGNVAEAALGGPTPGRGEHNPIADLGFEPLSQERSQAADLRQAVGSLSEAARRELYALMRVGQGHLSAKKWHHGLSEAELLGKEAIAAAFVEDADLHDHLAKGLYEIGLAS